jgi:hypothetical protein
MSIPIDDSVWVMKGKGTHFGPSLKLAFEKIENYIGKKDYAKLYFFTDGEANYPS